MELRVLPKHNVSRCFNIDNGVLLLTLKPLSFSSPSLFLAYVDGEKGICYTYLSRMFNCPHIVANTCLIDTVSETASSSK